MMGDVTSSVGEQGKKKLQTRDELVARMETREKQDRNRRHD